MSDGYQACGDAPAEFTPHDACQIFAGLHSTYLALMAGQNRTMVKIGDRETRFSRADLPAIETALYRYAAIAMRIDPTCARQVGADVWLQYAARAGHTRITPTVLPNVPYQTVAPYPVGRFR
ncbi:MAG: hypothetical protein P4L98_05660 [Ancalomicrobiaceae bacterium]|nr:hypothetical protein [Ancalomicrobiaceae bacterium]